MTKEKVLLLQIENRLHDNDLKYFMKINEKYCKKYDITYINLPTGPRNLPYYWWKVFMLAKLFDDNKHIDIFCWMDSDAFVYNTDIDVRDILNNHKEYSMYICPDPPNWGSPFMAGVFMIRNNNIGKKILNKWMNLFDGTKWSFKNNKWETTGSWAGNNYEQGSFVSNILTNPEFEKHIYSFPFYVFHEIDCKHPHVDCFSMHMAGPMKQAMKYCVKILSNNIKHDKIIDNINDTLAKRKIHNTNILSQYSKNNSTDNNSVDNNSVDNNSIDNNSTNNSSKDNKVIFANKKKKNKRRSIHKFYQTNNLFDMHKFPIPFYIDFNNKINNVSVGANICENFNSDDIDNANGMSNISPHILILILILILIGLSIYIYITKSSNNNGNDNVIFCYR